MKQYGRDSNALLRKGQATLNRHQEEIHKLASEARELMLPYFRKRGWDYITGNGTWYISKRIKGHVGSTFDTFDSVDDDKLPKWVLALLEFEISHNDYLGFYIVDIVRE